MDLVLGTDFCSFRSISARSVFSAIYRGLLGHFSPSHPFPVHRAPHLRLLEQSATLFHSFRMSSSLCPLFSSAAQRIKGRISSPPRPHSTCFEHPKTVRFVDDSQSSSEPSFDSSTASPHGQSGRKRVRSLFGRPFLCLPPKSVKKKQKHLAAPRVSSIPLAI